jgi:hypothetical protein
VLWARSDAKKNDEEYDDIEVIKKEVRKNLNDNKNG